MTRHDTPFAQRLRAAMGAARVSQRDVSRDCGVSPQAVQKWRDGVCMPKSSALMTICDLTGCSMEWLMHYGFVDMKSTNDAPEGKHAKYWVREALRELEAGQ